MRRPILTDRMVGIARRGHPAITRGAMSVETFASLPHLVVSASTRNATNFVDEALARQGLKRRIAMSVPSYLAAPMVVASSDLVALYAERIARTLVSRRELVIFEPPLPLPEFVVEIVVSKARAAEPALTWLMDRIEEICAEAGGSRRSKADA